jgi:hypothetical protein
MTGLFRFMVFWVSVCTAHGICDGFKIKGGSGRYSEEWHFFDVVMFAPIHAAICYPLALGGWGRFLLLFALSAMIRGVCHNFASRLVQGVSVNCLGSRDFWWDVDGVYIWLDKIHINQYAFQIFVISILTYSLL